MAENTTASPSSAKPLIVQGDRTILVEVASPRYAEARDALVRFAELVKSPEHVHTYRSPPSRSGTRAPPGESAEEIVETLRSLSRYPVPEHIATEIVDYAARFGSLTLVRGASGLELHCRDKGLADADLRGQARGAPARGASLRHRLQRPRARAGQVKLALIRIGYPVDDRAGYAAGEPFAFALRPVTLGRGPSLRAAALPARGRGGVPRGGLGARRLRGDRPALRRRQDHRRHALHGPPPVLHPRAHHLRHRRAAVDRGARGQDGHRPALIGEYTGQKKEVRPDHRRHLPDAHPPRQGRGPVPRRDIRDGGAAVTATIRAGGGPVPPPRAVQREGLGPDRLRRGAPPARPGVPDHRVPAGAAPAGAHRHPRAGGRQGGRRVRPHRAEEVRRALEGDGEAGLDREGGLHGDPRAPPRGHAHQLRPGRRADQVPHGLGEPGQDRRR